MAVIQRPTKSGGGRSYTSGQTILASEVNADFDDIYNEFGGNIANANISGSAAIALAKLAATADRTTADDPGSSPSGSAASNVGDEVEQLRYAIERLALGIDAVREDGGTSTTYWFDLPARGSNLVRNPLFVVQTGGAGTAPDGWAALAAGVPGTTCALGAKAAADGDGPMLNCVATAANEGIRQTLDGLKASTRYLAVAVVKPSVGTVDLTVGSADATSAFESFTAVSAGTTRQVLKGVFQTDATPTNITLDIASNANLDAWQLHAVGVFECSADPLVPLGPLVVHQSDATNTSAHYTAAAPVAAPGLDITVRVPGPNYGIRVQSAICCTNPSSFTRGIKGVLTESKDGAAASSVRTAVVDIHSTNSAGQFNLDYFLSNPTPGSSYRYRVTGQGTVSDISSNGPSGQESTLTVELVRMG